MPDRYWLGINQNWDDTANWSDTLGGSGGFSVPGPVDRAFAMGSKTINTSGPINIHTLTLSDGVTLNIIGNLLVSNRFTFGGGFSNSYLNVNQYEITCNIADFYSRGYINMEDSSFYIYGSLNVEAGCVFNYNENSSILLSGSLYNNGMLTSFGNVTIKGKSITIYIATDDNYTNECIFDNLIFMGDSYTPNAYIKIYSNVVIKANTFSIVDTSESNSLIIVEHVVAGGGT